MDVLLIKKLFRCLTVGRNYIMPVLVPMLPPRENVQNTNISGAFELLKIVAYKTGFYKPKPAPSLESAESTESSEVPYSYDSLENREDELPVTTLHRTFQPWYTTGVYQSGSSEKSIEDSPSEENSGDVLNFKAQTTPPLRPKI
jgi:hypothetical protein